MTRGRRGTTLPSKCCAEPGGGGDCRARSNEIAVVVENEGTGTTVSFVVRRVVDGEDDEAKKQTVAGLDAGKELEVRFEDVRPRRGLRDIAAGVDAGKAVAESDEDSNEVKIGVNCRAG